MLGDRASVQLKPKAFVEKGFVFVSTGYRLLPNVEMVGFVPYAEAGPDPPLPSSPGRPKR